MRACAHKHCVELLEAHQGINSGVVYLVMEHVEHSLSRELLLNPRGLPIAKAKLIGLQLASALELVHNKKVRRSARIALAGHVCAAQRYYEDGCS
jgi:serine/threonine protein kinase